MIPESEIELRRRYVDAAGLVVVKIGSGVLSSGGRLDRKVVRRLSADLAALRRTGRQLVVVSSGAIASGLQPLGLAQMPRSIVDKQAAAAVGQQVLMSAWTDAFKKWHIHVAQVLLTAEDVEDRMRYLNARHTLQSLLGHGMLPIVNENDSVSFDEIKMGDNDHLSALVSTLISAQLLIMLTDVEGLRRDGPHGCIIHTVYSGQSVHAHVKRAKSRTGVGGMESKVSAVGLVGEAGIPAIIAGGAHNNVLSAIAAGEGVGTFFEPKESSLDPRRRWIATAARPRGAIVVDDGAKMAIVQRKASLLPSGISAVEGRFPAGAVVRVRDQHGHAFALGLASYASDEIERVRGRKGSELPAILGYRYLDEIVHRSDMVVLTGNDT